MLMCKVGGLMLMNLFSHFLQICYLVSINALFAQEFYIPKRKERHKGNFDMTPLDKNKPGECECEHLFHTQK